MKSSIIFNTSKISTKTSFINTYETICKILGNNKNSKRSKGKE